MFLNIYTEQFCLDNFDMEYFAQLLQLQDFFRRNFVLFWQNNFHMIIFTQFLKLQDFAQL